MTKDDLVGMFRTAHNNCKLVYATLVLFGHEDMAAFYAQWSASLRILKPYDEAELLALLHDRDILKHACGQLYDTVHRTALTEMFEMTKAYCQETSQDAILTAQPWYQFWRIIRNCFSHDFRFTFRDYDKKQLPITWSGVTLDLSLEAKPLTQGTLPRQKLLALLDEVKTFVEKGLA
jgi:hypothetical protein